MTLQALIFDVDGTLADTEEVHRRSFNAAFAHHGLDWDWTPELYRRLLRTAGGKERLAHYIGTLRLPPAEARRLTGLVPDLHAEKTRRFFEELRARGLAPRPGIARLIAEARAAGLALAIASTTTPANVEALLPCLFGPDAPSWFDVVATGDVVPRKKPAPDIYELALARLGAAPERCVAFEDSDLGLRAAKAAGLYTVATPNWWTAEHDLSAADLLLPSLGDPAEPLDPEDARRIGGSWLALPQLAALRRAGTPFPQARKTTP